MINAGSILVECLQPVADQITGICYGVFIGLCIITGVVWLIKKAWNAFRDR